MEIELTGAESPSLRARWVVNAAGLDAVPLAHRTEGLPKTAVPAAHFAKGSYFTCSQRVPFSHLIYPGPDPGGLGVHLTLDQAGKARFGPDVEWVAQPEYQVDVRRGERFYAAIRRYWPALNDAALTPAYAGVRPKIVGRDEPAADFRIDGPAAHGIAGLVNLFGIESPGITAALAIADHVASILSGAVSSPR
jgi:L-2-hydroxyglutarate oxidase LhgO